jgi:Secretion system C-terminal sorting domain
MIDNPLAEPGDTITSSPDEPNPIPYGTYVSVCLSIEEDTILGMPARVKYLGDGSMFETSHTLAEGLGLFSYSFTWDFGHTDVSLVYAKIDGKEYGKILTDVKALPVVPKMFALSQNYPNPFNPSTVISYQLPVNSHVVLKVYDILGREVATLVNEREQAGTHGVKFDGANLPSGVYFYRLATQGFVRTMKMILLK